MMPICFAYPSFDYMMIKKSGKQQKKKKCDGDDFLSANLIMFWHIWHITFKNSQFYQSQKKHNCRGLSYLKRDVFHSFFLNYIQRWRLSLAALSFLYLQACDWQHHVLPSELLQFTASVRGVAHTQARERLAAPQQQEAVRVVLWGVQGHEPYWHWSIVVRRTPSYRILKETNLSSIVSTELTFSSAAGSGWWAL